MISKLKKELYFTKLNYLFYKAYDEGKITRFDDENFTNDLNSYLSLIEYDENQIHEERQKALKKIFENKKAMAVISGNDCVNVND